MYGSKCSSLHINRQYEWKLIEILDDLTNDRKYSLLDFVLSNEDCERIELGYTNPIYEDVLYKADLNNYECELDFKNMILTQCLINDDRIRYKMERISTKSDFEKNSNFPFIKYLTKWLWYYKKSSNDFLSYDQSEADAKFIAFDRDSSFLIDSIKLEKHYHEFLIENKPTLNYIHLQLDFGKMLMTDKNMIEYKIIRRPFFKYFKASFY